MVKRPFYAEVKLLVRGDREKKAILKEAITGASSPSISLCCNHFETPHPSRIFDSHVRFIKKGLNGQESVRGPTRPQNASQRLPQKETPSTVPLRSTTHTTTASSNQSAPGSSKKARKPPRFKPYATLQRTQRRKFEQRFKALVNGYGLHPSDVSKIMGWDTVVQVDEVAKKLQLAIRAMVEILRQQFSSFGALLGAWLAFTMLNAIGTIGTIAQLAIYAGCSLRTMQRAQSFRVPKVRAFFCFFPFTPLLTMWPLIFSCGGRIVEEELLEEEAKIDVVLELSPRHRGDRPRWLNGLKTMPLSNLAH